MGFLPSPSARRCVEHHRLCSCSFPGWEHNSLLRDGSPGHTPGRQQRGQNKSFLLFPKTALAFLVGARQG